MLNNKIDWNKIIERMHDYADTRNEATDNNYCTEYWCGLPEVNYNQFWLGKYEEMSNEEQQTLVNWFYGLEDKFRENFI